MVDLFKNITVAFFAANGLEHVMSAVKDYTNKGQPVQLADTDESNDEEDVTPVVEG